MGFFDAPVSGMDTFQQMMNIIGNNISNSNTVGFKASEVNFADMLSQTIKSGSGGPASGATGIGGTNPQQVGLGVTLGSVNPVFTQGSLTQTGTPSDMAIDGSGFIAVSNVQSPTSASQIFYTRAGDFQVDSNGNLVTPNGYYVLGQTTAPSATQASSTFPNKAINILDASGSPQQYTVGNNGQVSITNGATPTYWIPIANFPNPDGLEKIGNNLYAAPTGGNTGNVMYGQAASGNFGAINQGFLESSNVDLTKELSNMLIAQTGYSSNSKVISTQNQMFQSLLQNV
ncbi:flagellar hook-basal body protein [Alicyclobacillus mengziensis]|uniref:Flagellar hook protein FlgE n=1 Tax=Alicyclobacillus mengziensis TaxID=2931921 RepID=A0A9X7VZY9_9BACL|nr:flagellar hook-basal body complex protein [Alicyclobacillus mengziensis]QSO48156.1 flagellar hook-basal body complex protein [Alicyclobacillus mengziensis]